MGRARRFQWPLLLLWAAAAGPGTGQEVQTENVTVAEGGVAEITCRLHQIATLTVLVAPENPVVEVREQAVEGGEVELSCLVPRSRPAAVLRWYRDRKELKGVSSGQENGKVWSVASTVRFRVDRKDDGGIVICEAQNQALPSGHSKQTQYVLDVQYSPTS